MNSQRKIKQEMDLVIRDLENKGIKHNTNENEMTGLGDLVEASLNKFGITQERFKSWFGLKDCNCNERKKYLNNLFSWKKKEMK